MSVPQIYQRAPGDYHAKVRYTDSIVALFPDVRETKSSGYKHYMREKSFWDARLSGYSDAEEGKKAYNAALRLHAFHHASKDALHKTSSTQFPTWNQLSDFTGFGKTGVTNNTYKQGVGVGLVNDIEINPQDPDSWTIAVAGGGVWQTSNQGQQWYNLDPNHELPTQDAWDVEMNPSNPNEIYVALTGYKNTVLLISSYSLGIYKTINNGQNWTLCDTIVYPTSDAFRESWSVRRVKVDVFDNDRVYAYGALRRSGNVEDQFWYSNSKGDTFTRVPLFPFIHLAYQNRLKAHWGELYEDICLAQNSDHNYMYLSGQNLLRSSDNGISWTDITPNLSFLNDNTKPCYGHYPMEMRMAANDSILYVAYSAQSTTYSIQPSGDTTFEFTGTRNKIYLEYSTDWGSTWHQISLVPDTMLSTYDGEFYGGELGIAIAPGSNSSIYSNNKIVVGYVDYALSTDGGQNFNRITAAYDSLYPNPKWVHPDNRGLRLLPNNAFQFKIISANDGGVAYSDDSGSNWNIRIQGLNSEPLGGIGLWERNSDTLMAGCIHIGGILKLGNTCYTSSLGDYGDAVIAPSNTNINFSGSQVPFHIYENVYGSLKRNGAGNNFMHAGYYPGFAFAVHPSNPSVLHCGKGKIGTSNSFIMQSTDYGANWLPSTNGETEGVKNFTDISHCKKYPSTMYAIASENILYGGTKPFSKIIWKSTNAGMGWFDITGTAVSNPLIHDHLQWIHNAAGIVADPDDSAKVFIYYTSFGDQEDTARVVMSTDGGSSWSNISKGLPAFPVTDLVCVPGDEDEMFLSNDVSVYYACKDSGYRWLPFDNSLPVGGKRDLEYHYKDRKLFVATTGRGIWVSELPCSHDTTATITISGNVLWDSDRSPLNHIIIPANCTLTIQNCQVRMRDNRFISVERGGLLIVDNATLTSCSNTTRWRGIMVLGDPNHAIQAYAPYGNFGKVVVKNQSVIENAHQGISLCKSDYTTLAVDYSTCGGILEATNSIFKNCRKSIEFMKHPAAQYNALIQNCDFINTQPNTSASQVFVSLWGVKEVVFQGCRFSNYTSDEDYKMRGVYSIDASYKFVDDGANRNTFLNLAYGIQVENSISVHHIAADHCSFVNCGRGVFWSNANFSKVTNSDFQIRNYNPYIPYGWCVIPNQFGDTYGIYSDFSNAFTIEENTFSSFSGLTIHDTTLGYDRQNGCVIRNNYGYADNLYRNKFEDLLVGVKSVGINRKLTSFSIPNALLNYVTQPKGLQIRCNEFAGDIPYTDIGVLGLVAEYQGQNDPILKLAAGNLFGSGSTQIPGGPGKNIWYIPDYPALDTIMGFTLNILNDSLNHMYYMHDLDGNMIPTRLQYANLDTVIVDFRTSTFKNYNPSQTCPKKVFLINNEPPFSWDAITVWNDSIAIGTSLLTQGDAVDLIDAIDYEPIEDAKALLDLASPYLSDRILTHIIDKAYIEYAAEWKEVLVNNSPLPGHLYPLTFEIEMPQAARDELEEVQMEAFSPRDYLNARITLFQDSIDLHLKQSTENLLPRVVASTVSRDSLLELYEKERSVQSILKRIDLCLFTEEYTLYDQLLDTLEAEDIELYADLAALLRDFSSVYASIAGIQSISPTLKADIEAYVENRKPFYERFENILISSGDRTRCYPDISLKHGIGGAAFRHIFPDATLRKQLVEGWNVFPNPSDGLVFEFLRSEDEVAYEVIVYDVSGKVIMNTTRQLTNKKYILPTETMSPGLYFAKVKTKNGKSFTHKLLLK